MYSVLTLGFTFLAGLLLGAGSVWLAARGRLSNEQQLADKFKALAADTLRQNNETFLHLAESRLKQSEQAASATLEKRTTAIDEMVKPVKESLQRMDAQIQALEIKREGAYRELTEMVVASRETHLQLRHETSQLLQALRTPTSRGRWGEMQLKRILEMTGMSSHAHDFTTQQTIIGDEGDIRPDIIVSLPGKRCIIVDSKVPLAAYLDAVQSSDEATRQNALKQHARQVKDHIKKLGNKAYWGQIEGTAEFVVLFLPGEHLLSAALDGDADLMDYSAGQKVVLATPMTLIALLRTVAHGWRQEALNENVRKIGELGGELYGALYKMTELMTNLGGKLGGSIKAYNDFVSSFERNILTKALRLREYGAAKDGRVLPETIEPIDLQSRLVTVVQSENPAKEDAA